jgi:diketogulonate reductase-like aldo/keto reductase
MNEYNFFNYRSSPLLHMSIPTLALKAGKIPVVGLGVGIDAMSSHQVYQSAPGAETYDAVKAAIQMGYRHIDTAALYGNEGDVGRVLSLRTLLIAGDARLWGSQGGDLCHHQVLSQEPWV